MKRLASLTLLAFLGTAAVVLIPKNSHATTPTPIDESFFINKTTEVTPTPTPVPTKSPRPTPR